MRGRLFQVKIDKLKVERQKKTEQANQRLEQIKREDDRKVQAPKEKAAHARGETKAAIDTRVTGFNKDYQRTVAKWKNAESEELEKGADLLEEKAKKLRSQTSTPKQLREGVRSDPGSGQFFSSRGI
jgi:hypothetical protein